MDELIVNRDRPPPTPPQQPGGGLTGGQIAGILVGAVFLAIVLSQVPDLIRYVRISSM
ncbi:MAG TPA: hypothetical protein VFX06_10645 [Stellaceae bacterium]|nr:hypothetical protein [Stellaceae bacterium]